MGHESADDMSHRTLLIARLLCSGCHRQPRHLLCRNTPYLRDSRTGRQGRA